MLLFGCKITKKDSNRRAFRGKVVILQQKEKPKRSKRLSSHAPTDSPTIDTRPYADFLRGAADYPVCPYYHG
jgi:hypothetical protein